MVLQPIQTFQKLAWQLKVSLSKTVDSWAAIGPYSQFLRIRYAVTDKSSPDSPHPIISNTPPPN